MTTKTVVGTVGSVSEFVPGSADSWEVYREQLGFYFEANEIITENKKKAVFYSACGKVTYATLRSLATPRKPSELTFDEAVKLLSEHFNPRPSKFVQRFKFNRRDQLPNETLADYLAELRRLSEHCEFTDLEEMLLDRLICGMRDERLQRRLLADADLTFKKVKDAALADESANKNISELKANYNTGQQVESTINKQHESKRRACFRCNGSHFPETCTHIQAECKYCKKIGHVEGACFQKKRDGRKDLSSQSEASKKKKTSKCHRTEEDEECSSVSYLFNISGRETVNKRTASILIEGFPVEMEIDSGAGHTIIGRETFNRIWPTGKKLDSSKIILRTWSKQQLEILGECDVEVQFRGSRAQLRLMVMANNGPSLLGRDWFGTLGISVSGTHFVQEEAIPSALERYKEVFRQELGNYRGTPIKIVLDEGSRPIFRRHRVVPLALQAKVEAELTRMVKEGVLEQVKQSDWATPIVPVLKRNGDIRICGDYKSTVNTVIKTDVYPLPTITEGLAVLAGGKIFTKLDLDRAYTQVRVDEESSKILTLNTTKGLFQVKRLPFGISSAPACFQRLMETILGGLEGIIVYLDDILITGRSIEEHWQRVQEVLKRFEEVGLRINRNKCAFARHSVEFLGFRIDAEGVHPTDEKVRAIKEAAPPKNKTELESFLGLMNFYERFMPNKASVAGHLYELLSKKAVWEWGSKQEQAFRQCKELLTTDRVLTHYDQTLPLLLACDASPYGVGAVLSHKLPDGSEAPIAFGSRTLQTSEKNYAQIDKEALAIMFGLKKFHRFIWGRPVTILTDHKPLLGLLQQGKAMPETLSPRMLRWNLILGSYNFVLNYRPGKKQANADACSRLPLPHEEEIFPEPADVLLLEEAPTGSPLTAENIEQATLKDQVLARVRRAILHGTIEELPNDPDYIPWKHRNGTLSVLKGCVLWGNRVIIPKVLRATVLGLLHKVHQGINRTKAIARSYVWWPALDKDIEEMIGNCAACVQTRKEPRKADPVSWAPPGKPWSRIHVDFAGPTMGHTYLVMVDAHSKWPEVKETGGSMSADTVIKCFREAFATHGIPDVVISDNGTGFVAAEVKDYLHRLGIKFIQTAPYHPASNGLAERMVQTLKHQLKKIPAQKWQVELANILLALRSTPCATTGKSPAELLMGRRLRTLLDKFHPETSQNCEGKGEEKPVPQNRKLSVSDDILYRNFGRGPKWESGKIEEINGPRNFTIRTADGDQTKRHLDQIIRKPVATATVESIPESMVQSPSQLNTRARNATPVSERVNSRIEDLLEEEHQAWSPRQVHTEALGSAVEDDNLSEITEKQPENDYEKQTQELRRSGRITRPVNRLNL